MDQNRKEKLTYSQKELNYLLWVAETSEELQAISMIVFDDRNLFDYGWFIKFVERYEKKSTRIYTKQLDMKVKGKIDEFVCSAGHVTVVKMVDEGIPNYEINCKAEGCRGYGRSQFYECDQDQDWQYEFSKPTEQDMKDFEQFPHAQYHVMHNGLVLHKKEV